MELATTVAGVESMIDEDRAWEAVLARDARHDGRFVYAVISTGVYCRPSCPSRRPRRAAVRVFSTPEAAEAAGFRACRRCEPVRAGASTTVERVFAARRYVDSRLDEPMTLKRLARAVGLSPFHLQRTFKRVLGITPTEYVRIRRLERVKAQLRTGQSVTDATYEAGYGSGSRLYEQSNAWLGMTPATYQRGGRGMSIRFSVVSSAVGRVLCAFTERGLCAVMLGTSDRALEGELRREFPNATITRHDRAAPRYVEVVRRSAEGHALAGELPLDLQATAFQWKVWRALQRIPLGTTRSYKEVAASLGRPRAVRAVARACATNPVALVVPCHRVVRQDGSLGGYRWGLETKKHLLERERRRAASHPRGARREG